MSINLVKIRQVVWY